MTSPAAPTAPLSKKKPLIALYNYGGGMRGLIPAHFMQRIEDVTGLHMADMVDVFLGASTGSILNAALNIPNPQDPGKPKFRARHMVRFYEREGIQIFPQDAFRSFRSMIHDFNNRTMKIGQLDQLLRHGHYERANLGRALRALFGRHKLSESLSGLVIPVYDIDASAIHPAMERGDSQTSPVHTISPIQYEGGRAVWLKNLKFDGALNPGQIPDVALYDAVMGSTAAPTYFPCHHFTMRDTPSSPEREITGIDGSIFDNPCISYMGALRPHIPEDRELILIALGTGYANRSIRKEDWNRYGSLGVVDPSNDMPLINIFFYASESALFDAFSAEMEKNFYLFNKSLISGPFSEDFPSTQIDDASPDNVHRLKNFFEMTLEENRKKFDTVCDLLVRNYESRQAAAKDDLPPTPPSPEKPPRRFSFFRG
jgi:predicted acylesterase/phospholipase RssA